MIASHFRDQLIAAPLKPDTMTIRSLSVLAFPRSADRGPIEALSFIRDSCRLP